MSWNCTLTEERLSDFIDGLLSQREASAFTSHLATCPACARLSTQVGALVHRMHAIEAVEEPDHLSARILDVTLGPRKPKASFERWFGWLPNLLQPRFAVGMATVAASFVLVLHTAGITPNRLKKTDWSPASVLRDVNRQAHLTYAKGVKFVNDLRVVYEIQSRLQPEPQPSAEPVHQPAPKNPDPSPDTNPQEKSQAHPGPSQIRSREMLACLLPQTFSLETHR